MFYDISEPITGMPCGKVHTVYDVFRRGKEQSEDGPAVGEVRNHKSSESRSYGNIEITVIVVTTSGATETSRRKMSMPIVKMSVPEVSQNRHF